MKTIRTLIFVLLLSLLWAGSVCARMPIDELTANIQARYEETSDLKARFVQEVVLKTAKKTQVEKGTVYFKKPRRMLWDYTQPQSKKLVINPKTAWLYVPEDKMVYVQDSKNVFSSGHAVRFLAGIGKLRDEFDIKYAQAETDSSGNYLLEMIPKGGPEAAGGVRKLLAIVDKKTYLITRVSFKDSLGNETVISFHDLKTNIGMTDSMFTFTPPAGTEVQKVQ